MGLLNFLNRVITGKAPWTLSHLSSVGLNDVTSVAVDIFFIVESSVNFNVWRGHVAVHCVGNGSNYLLRLSRDAVSGLSNGVTAVLHDAQISNLANPISIQFMDNSCHLSQISCTETLKSTASALETTHGYLSQNCMNFRAHRHTPKK